VRSEYEAGERSSSPGLISIKPGRCGGHPAQIFIAHRSRHMLADASRRARTGRFNGSIEEQLRPEAAIAAGAKAADVEIGNRRR
jgi:hypothetical protein